MTWLPNSEITSTFEDLQNGQAVGLVPSFSPSPSGGGLGGGLLSTGGHVSLFRETLQHVERSLIDATKNAPSPNRVPLLPVDCRLRLTVADTLLERPPKLVNAG